MGWTLRYCRDTLRLGTTRILSGYAAVGYAGDTRLLDTLWPFQSSSPIRWILEILHDPNYGAYLGIMVLQYIAVMQDF